MVGMKDIASIHDVAPGGTLLLDDGLLLIRDLDGDFHVTEDRCPHVGWSLRTGTLHEDAVIECPLHHGLWNLRSGDPVRYPARVPMKIHRVEVRGETVWLVD